MNKIDLRRSPGNGKKATSFLLSAYTKMRKERKAKKKGLVVLANFG